MPLATLLVKNVLDGLDYELVCYPGSRALVVTDSIPFAKKLGIYYMISGKIDISAGASAYFLCRIPSTRRVTVGVMAVSALGGPLDVGLYEAPTVSSVGTALTPVNANREAGASGVSVYGGPTLSADGTRILYNLIPAGHKDAGIGGGTFAGIILAVGTDYVFKITNNGNSTATIGYDFHWIEENV